MVTGDCAERKCLFCEKAPAYYQLGKVANISGHSSLLDDDFWWALTWRKEHLRHAKPRVVRTGMRRNRCGGAGWSIALSSSTLTTKPRGSA